MPAHRAIVPQQTVKELFEPEPPSSAAGPAPVISLGTLALSLGCDLARLLPLAQHGFLHLRSAPPLSSASLVDSPPEPALLWLRSWLQPAQAKPLLTAADLTDLLDLADPRDAVRLAAEHNVPVCWEPALGGHLFSVRAARALTLAVVRGREPAARWDRQAWLALLLDGDPERQIAPERLTYSEALEREIERAAELPEPQRSLRASALLDQFEDARRVVESAGNAAASSADRLASGLPARDVADVASGSADWSQKLSALRPGAARRHRGRLE